MSIKQRQQLQCYNLKPANPCKCTINGVLLISESQGRLFLIFGCSELEEHASSDHEPPVIEDPQRRLQLQALDNEIEYNEALITEREGEIQEIEQGITELNEIFRDLGTLVNEQETGIRMYIDPHSMLHLSNTLSLALLIYREYIWKCSQHCTEHSGCSQRTCYCEPPSEECAQEYVLPTINYCSCGLYFDTHSRCCQVIA
jgi:hypothetical protein